VTLPRDITVTAEISRRWDSFIDAGAAPFLQLAFDLPADFPGPTRGTGMSFRLPRDSKEFIPVVVTVDGATVTTNVEVALVKWSATATTWAAAITLDSRIGLLYDPAVATLTGTYRVRVRVTDSPELPVLDAGTIVFV
jgi:hypothetical protein